VIFFVAMDLSFCKGVYICRVLIIRRKFMRKRSPLEADKLNDLILELLLADGATMLSDEEASVIVAQNIKMTGKEFVDSIYAKLGMERPVD